MADFDSSLPVRTESAGDIDIFISDSTTPTQKLKVNADGSIDTTFASGSAVEITDGTDTLAINVDGSLNATVTATDLDIRDLTSASDSVEILQDTHDDLNLNANLQVGDADVANGNPVPVSDAGGSLTVDATDLDIRDLSSASDSVEVLQDTHDDLNLNANLQVNDTDVSSTNPVPVYFEESAGTEIVDYQTSSAVAAAASVNHDYTVSTGATFLGEELWASGSGKLKVEVLVDGATVFVGFNSTANPNVRIPLDKVVKAGTAEVVRITLTNRDKQAQDVYSTLTGVERS